LNFEFKILFMGIFVKSFLGLPTLYIKKERELSTARQSRNQKS